MSMIEAHPSSFRDPSGFVYRQNGRILRQINPSYGPDWDHLIRSGLRKHLEDSGWIPVSSDLDPALALQPPAHALVEVQPIPLISYPYEWSFSQLKDAALATLVVMEQSLEFGMVLKDASAYNIQWNGSRPVLIDLLSFERYEEGTPWIAYRQFCQHFLAPLALMAHTDVSLSKLSQVYIDGIPLGLAAELLPAKTKLNMGLLTHLHMHAKSVGQSAKESTGTVTMSKTALKALVDHLKSVVSGLHWNPTGTEWGDYYSDTNYSVAAMDAKRDIVRSFLNQIPREHGTCWDLGANTGAFSQVAAESGFYTVAWDIDPAAVEKAYLGQKKAADNRILPLLVDLTNPSPAIGWAHQERDSFASRAEVDVTLALALVHHLAISNNVPMPRVAEFFAQLSRYLVIEFVPKSDSQVRRLLGSRKDIFPTYTVDGFEAAFGRFFEVNGREPVPESDRILYLLERKDGA